MRSWPEAAADHFMIGMLLLAVVLLIVAESRARYVRPYGRRRRRQLARLRQELAGLPRGCRRDVVHWLDYSSLTKDDIADLLWERGLALRGQEPRAAGWPLQVGPAQPADRPPSRQEMLVAELRRVEALRVREYDLDLVPYQDLERGHVGRVAEAFGWRVGRVEVRSGPVLRLRRLVLPRTPAGNPGGRDHEGVAPFRREHGAAGPR